VSINQLELDRHHELAEFLRSRRARLSPEQVGVPRGTRRRTPGLRRGEVALLAGVSPEWYTWLEQGRDIHVSVQVLESLAVDCLSWLQSQYNNKKTHQEGLCPSLPTPVSPCEGAGGGQPTVQFRAAALGRIYRYRDGWRGRRPLHLASGGKRAGIIRRARAHPAMHTGCGYANRLLNDGLAAGK
jgi:hypothetical protein